MRALATAIESAMAATLHGRRRTTMSKSASNPDTGSCPILGKVYQVAFPLELRRHGSRSPAELRCYPNWQPGGPVAGCIASTEIRRAVCIAASSVGVFAQQFSQFTGVGTAIPVCSRYGPLGRWQPVQIFAPVKPQPLTVEFGDGGLEYLTVVGTGDPFLTRRSAIASRLPVSWVSGRRSAGSALRQGAPGTRRRIRAG